MSISAYVSLLLAATQAPSAEPTRYALIIGTNQPFVDGQTPLRYADDDAVRYFQLFSRAANETALFALLDSETQSLFPEAVARAEPPRRAAVLARVERLFDRIREDRARGKDTEFYFIYSGHGRVDETGEGHLGLGDGTLRRADLYEKIIGPSPASINHVIIDACDAYYFVESRGDPRVDQVLTQRAKEFLDKETLSHYPETGAILSTASAADAHEWSEIRAGVFSHEVRSGLFGAADANGDGKVGYDELEAFIRSANRGIQHANVNRAIFVRSPGRDRTRPVLTLSALQDTRPLNLSETHHGRITVSDDLGRRWVDMNKAPGHASVLRILSGTRYWVRHQDLDYRIASSSGAVSLSQIQGTEPLFASRGAISDAFTKGIFSIPFGPDFVDGFSLGAELSPVAMNSPNEFRPRPLLTMAWTTGIAAAVGVGIAIGTNAVSNAAHRDYQATQDLTRLSELEAKVHTWDSATNIAIGVSSGLAATAITALILDFAGVEF